VTGALPVAKEAFPLGELGILVPNLIFQIIAFIMFLWLLNRFAMKPLLRMLDARAERINESMQAADRIERDLAETQRRNQEALDEARREAQSIVARSREAGEELLTRAREEATAQRERELERARQQIRAETQQAKDELRREVADLAVLAAGRIVHKELDQTTHLALIQETLAEAGNGRPATQ
jgi:F-type H+-transporting ATPase subunit b